MKTTTATVTECLPNLEYRVDLPDGRNIRAYTAGKLRQNRIRAVIGDKVDVELPDTGEIGRVIRRK